MRGTLYHWALWVRVLGRNEYSAETYTLLYDVPQQVRPSLPTSIVQSRLYQ